MRAAFEIASKDRKQKVRDRAARLVSIVAPFALATLFSLVLGNIDEDFHAHWAFVDLDGGELAVALDEGPISAMEDAGIITVERLASAEEARAAVEAGEVETAIIVPEGFTSGYLLGEGGSVELIVDPDATISGQVARSVLAGFATQADAVQLSIRSALAAGQGFPAPAIVDELAARAQEMADPITIVDAAAADRQAGYSTYYAGAMAILFVFFAAQFGLISIHAERRSGTLGRMLAAPLRWWSIVLGKLTASMALALLSMTVIILGTGLLLGATWGDPVAVAALVVSAAVAAVGISLLAVAFTRTEEQAGSAIAIVTLSLAVLGGSFFPANQGPELLAKLSLITPHAWFLRGVNDLSTGGDISTIISPLLVLLAIGLVTGGLGMLRARKMVMG